MQLAVASWKIARISIEFSNHFQVTSKRPAQATKQKNIFSPIKSI
jgi:hypothetical protein